MRKYILLALCLVSSLSFAQEIVCADKLLCTENGCRPFPRTLGDIWVSYEGRSGGQGFVNLQLIGLTHDKHGLCIYDGGINFVSTITLYQDLKAPDGRWNLDNDRCISTMGHYCPFTDVKPADSHNGN